MNPSSFQFTLPDTLRDPSSSTSSPMHIHIHLGDPVASVAMPSAPVVAAAAAPRRSGFSWLAITGLGLFLVSAGFIGGRWEQASADPAVSSIHLPIAPQDQAFEPQQAARIPPALQRELAMPPTVTPPQDAAPASAKPPFGLQN